MIRAPRPPNATTMGAISCLPISGCSSGITSRRSPGLGRSSGRRWRRNSDIYRALCGCSRVRCSRDACRTSSFCSARSGATVNRSAKWRAKKSAVAVDSSRRLAVLAIMVILLGVVALVIVNALKSSPWATFTLAMTIPIALLLGVYLRFVRPGRVLEASLIGVALILFVVVAGEWVADSPSWAKVFTIGGIPLAAALIVYAFAASALAGMVVAGAARLSQRVHQGGRDLFARGGNLIRAAARRNAAADAIHRRHRAGIRRQDFSVLLHHDCMRRDQRISRADLVGHDAEDDPARRACALHRLRRDAAGIVRRRDGDDRGVRDAAGRLFRDQQSVVDRRRNGRVPRPRRSAAGAFRSRRKR